MAILREILEGDTSHFAFKVSFQDDPENGAGSTPELSLSWGAFEIWVNGLNLCAHLEDGQIVHGTHWYLLPLLEWFATNWNPIFHEEKFPIRTTKSSAWESLESSTEPPLSLLNKPDLLEQWELRWQDWWKRHALVSCREGGLFPDIVFRRASDTMEVSWGRARLAGMPNHFRFLSESGCEQHDLERVATALHRVVVQAHEYLISKQPGSVRLQNLGRKISAFSQGDPVERMAWIAGLGFSIDTMKESWSRACAHIERKSAEARSLLEVNHHDLVTIGSCQAAMMFGSLNPAIAFDDVLLLADKMVEFTQLDAESDEFRRLVRPEPLAPAPTPYEQGYGLALEVLGRLGLLDAESDWIDVEKVLKSLGIALDDLELSDTSIRGVAIAGPLHRPVVLVNPAHGANSYPSGRRYTMAHELCHLLFDRDIGNKLALASGAWAPKGIEQRANAFAAMFLMPSQLVDRAITGISQQVTTNDAVVQIAQKLHVSRTSLLPHLKNLSRIDDEIEEQIEREHEHEVLRARTLRN